MENKNTETKQTQSAGEIILKKSGKAITVKESTDESLKFLNDSINSLDLKIKNLEDKASRFNQVSLTITGIVIAIVFGSAVLVSLDFFKYNEERYEKFIDKTEEIKDDFYTKAETDKFISDFKNCIWFNGLSHCLK